MSKRKTQDESVCVLAVAVKSELNDEECHAVLHFTPTPLERMLLELYENHPEQFAPAEYRDVDPGSMANVLVNKYNEGDWEERNPLSTAKEEDESDDEVVEFLRNRRERRKTEYDFVVETDYLSSDADLAQESFDTYLHYVKRKLRKILHSKDAKQDKVVHLLQRLDLIDFAREFCLDTKAKPGDEDGETAKAEDSEEDD